MPTSRISPGTVSKASSMACGASLVLMTEMVTVAVLLSSDPLAIW